jgi:hypothetical protein
MNSDRFLPSGLGLFAAFIILVLLATLAGGCSSEDSPAAADQPEPPVLPSSEQMQFDFSFFDQGEGLEKSRLDKADWEYSNFVNAYLRVVVLDVMAHVVLAAPVSAFSAAVHTVPEAQADGAWLWTYTWQSGTDSLDILLRGLPAGDVVEWELSLAPTGSNESVLWFSGTTNERGEEGRFVFRDLDDQEYPVSGEINWGPVEDGSYLEFVSRMPGEDGDTLRFTDRHPEYVIDFLPGDGSESSWISWMAAGSGSLRVPDYNDGQPACWGIDLKNADCP